MASRFLIRPIEFVMMNYPVLCYEANCGQPAVYKIAAQWSDGLMQELKTFSLSCQAHLAGQFASSLERHGKTRLLPGEISERPGIFQLTGGWRDKELVRLEELEAQLLSGR
jgi:hypothetical protein